MAADDTPVAAEAEVEAAVPVTALEAVERAHAAAGEETAGAADTEVQPKPEAAAAQRTYHVPPEEKWQGILGNARTEAVREFREKYGWAESLTKEQVQHAMQIAGRLQTREQARAFYKQLGDELKSIDPEDEEVVDPEPDLQSEDGKHRAFSDIKVRALLANQEKRLLATIRKEMAPTAEFTRSEQARRQEAAAMAQIDTTAKEAVTAVLALPHANENKAAIAEELKAMDPGMRERLGPYGSMQYAYNRMLARVILPGYDKAAEKRVKQSFQRDAAASAVTIRPGGETSIGKSKLKLGDTDGLARHIKHLHESAK